MPTNLSVSKRVLAASTLIVLIAAAAIAAVLMDGGTSEDERNGSDSAASDSAESDSPEADDATDTATDVAGSSQTEDAANKEEVAQPDLSEDDRLRSFDGLDNVDNTLFALGSVWAVTSDLPDNFSLGEAGARLLRIEPATGRSVTLVEKMDQQPTLVEVGGVVWAKLDDRIVSFDANGDEVSSIPWELRGDLLAGDRYLWVTDFHGAQVTVIEPTTGETVDVVETVRFPVAPIVAFGHAWLPSSTDGTVSVIDEATVGKTTNLMVPVTEARLTDVTAIPNGVTGDEVWVTNIHGELFSISAGPESFGELRPVEVDRSINRLIPAGDQLLMLPTWGLSVLVADLQTGETLAEITLDAIPYRAIVHNNEAWISTDGGFEGLFRISLETLMVVERFSVGNNKSETTGPTQPFVVGDEIWIANRGDDSLFAIGA